MSLAVASQYAKALIDVVAKPGSSVEPSAALAQLESFRDALSASPELREVLMSPAVSPANKTKAIDRLASMMGLSPVVVNFLRVVRDRRRVGLVAEICVAFREQMDERLGIVRARVASARSMGGEQREVIAAKLRAATGKRVEMDFSVDPDLVGGVTVQIGSTVYDGSVQGQLEGLKRRLAAEG